jgi:hypothetical protein
MVGEARKIEVPILLISGEREIASDEAVGLSPRPLSVLYPGRNNLLGGKLPRYGRR